MDQQPGSIPESIEAAIVHGDLAALEGLLREQGQRPAQGPRPWWLDRLQPDDSAGDARTLLVRNHEFDGWDQFASYASDLKDPQSPVAQFERAVDAIVGGDETALDGLLRDRPDLIRFQSTRRHHSTLLHYVGANGVEHFRQRTPPNAVRIAAMLLDAGAEVDAVADMYGGGCTTLGLVATSIHPEVAGVLHALIDLLLTRGARIDAQGSGRGYPFVNGCLANGRGAAARYLAERGAPLDLEGAAGVGWLDLVKSSFNHDGRLTGGATPGQVKDGFTWACEYGHTEVVEYLLDHGVDVAELLPRPHGQTGLHWAAYGGHPETVRALLKRGAPVDVKDRRFGGTPLGWALQGWLAQRAHARRDAAYDDVVALLVAAGAPVEPAWISEENARAHPRLVAALTGKERAT